MALLFMDSFDHYATADIAEKWTNSVAGTGIVLTIESAVGRHSSSAWRINPGSTSASSGYATKNIVSGDATCIIGCAVQISSGIISTSGFQILSIRDSGGTAQVSLRVNSDFTLTVLRGENSGGTVLGTPSVATLTASAYYYIEMKVFISNTVGTVEVKINGTTAINLTGQDTMATATATWTAVSLGLHSGSSGSFNTGSAGTVEFDDLYVCDGTGSAPWNTFLGDCRVDPCYPTAEGATIQWTPLSGTDNALMVDETAPDDDTTYNTAATTSLTDTLVVQDAPAVGATIYGIQHCLSMKKSDAGICTIAPVIRHSGVDNVGTAISPGTTYLYGLAINQTNPGTSAAWVEADFNAAEFGYKRLT